MIAGTSLALAGRCAGSPLITRAVDGGGDNYRKHQGGEMSHCYNALINNKKFAARPKI